MQEMNNIFTSNQKEYLSLFFILCLGKLYKKTFFLLQRDKWGNTKGNKRNKRKINFVRYRAKNSERNQQNFRKG